VRDALQKILLAVVATVAAVFLAEAGARLIGLPPGYGRLISTQETPHRVVDGIVLWGARDPRFDREDVRRAAQDPDAFTIVALGDSILFGVALPKELTYMEQARGLLQKRTTRTVEILNLAIPGYGTMQENAAFKELDPAVRPDLVVVHYWGDDALQYRAFGPYVVDFGDVTPDGRSVIRPFPLPPALSDYLLIHSRLYDLMTGVALKLTRNPEERDWTRVTKPMAEIQERAERGGGRLLILASADLTGTAAKPTADIALLREFAAARGIEVIDISEWLRGMDASELALDACHFNAQGHRLLAERFANYLLAHDLKEAL
jgi:lysophospholipase L1-like esterase